MNYKLMNQMRLSCVVAELRQTVALSIMKCECAPIVMSPLALCFLIIVTKQSPRFPHYNLARLQSIIISQREKYMGSTTTSSSQFKLGQTALNWMPLPPFFFFLSFFKLFITLSKIKGLMVPRVSFILQLL